MIDIQLVRDNSKLVREKSAQKGYEVDKRDIQLIEPIKVLGQHKAKLSFGEGLDTEIVVSVERAEGSAETTASTEG